MSKETGGPAFPQQGLDPWKSPHQMAEGMTLRQYAAIKLKVPDSGTEWLDDMIHKSQRDDFAAKAMSAFIGTAQDGMQFGINHSEINLGYAKASYAMADAMLEARK